MNWMIFRLKFGSKIEEPRTGAKFSELKKNGLKDLTLKIAWINLIIQF